MIAPSDLERLRINRYYRCIRQDLERINIIYDHLCYRFWQHYVENLSWNKSRFRSTWLTCVQPFSETKKEKVPSQCQNIIRKWPASAVFPCSMVSSNAMPRFCHGSRLVTCGFPTHNLSLSIGVSDQRLHCPQLFFLILARKQGIILAREHRVFGYDPPKWVVFWWATSEHGWEVGGCCKRQSVRPRREQTIHFC